MQNELSELCCKGFHVDRLYADAVTEVCNDFHIIEDTRHDYDGL